MATSPAQPSDSADHVRLHQVRPPSYGRDMILLDEEREVFERVGRNIENRYHPKTFEEKELAQCFHMTWWRLDRAVANEHNLYTLVEQQQLAAMDVLFGEQHPQIRRSLAQAAGYQANARIFGQIGREIARLGRLIEQTRRDLESRIEQRRQAELDAEKENTTEQSQSAPPNAAQMPEFTGPLKEFKRKQWLQQQEKRNHPPSAA